MGATKTTTIRMVNFKDYARNFDNRNKGSRTEREEREFIEWFSHHRELNKDIVTRIGMWKSPRPKKHFAKNSEEFVKEVGKIVFGTKNEEIRIKILLLLKGVSWPIASAILYFAFPDRYPIMDFRTIWSLGLSKPKQYAYDFWLEYCRLIREIANQEKLSIREVEKALWQYSLQHQESNRRMNIKTTISET